MKQLPSTMRAAFTLIEILVSVAVLVVVVLVCGKVFQAASGVTRISNAAGDVLQEAWGIEQRIREDLKRISPDGFLAIHSVEVPNDYNQVKWDQTGPRPPLINPSLPREAVVRCDQLMFLMDGFQRGRLFGTGGDNSDAGSPRIVGGAAAITYGHGVQFPELSRYSIEPPSSDEAEASMFGELPGQYHGHDVNLDDHRDLNNITRVAPFRRSNVSGQWGGRLDSVYSVYGYHSSLGGIEGYYNPTTPGESAATIRGDQPEARRWVLARQAMAMGDDDGKQLDAPNKQSYRSNALSVESLFPADPRRVAADQAGFNREAPVHDMGRVDVSAMGIGDVRKVLLHTRDKNNPEVEMARRRWFADDFPYTGNADLDVTGHDVLEDELVLPGLAGDLERGTQRYLLKTLMSWPRVERSPGSPARYDQSLTNSIVGTACSSFIVEWAWDDDVGETRTWKTAKPSSPHSRRNRVTWQGFRYDRREVDPDDLPTAGTATELDALGTPRQQLRQKGDLFWFGLSDKKDPSEPDDAWDRGVVSFSQFAEAYPAAPGIWFTPNDVLPESEKWPVAAASLVHPTAIDEEVAAFPGDPREYWALFGPNRRWPLMRELDIRQGNADPDNQSVPPDGFGDGLLDPDPSYTPWPSALRISMVLHDPETNLEHGKLVQFVIELPKERLR